MGLVEGDQLYMTVPLSVVKISPENGEILKWPVGKVLRKGYDRESFPKDGP